MGVSVLSVLIFMGLPVFILLWIWMVYRNNPA